MYMLICHRNMISIYDMTSVQNFKDKDKSNLEGRFLKTYKYNEGNIREIFIKKRAKKSRQQYAKNIS